MLARRSGSLGLATPQESLRQNGPTLSETPMRLSAQLSDIPRPSPARSYTSISQKLDSSLDLKGDPDDLFARHTISEVKAVQIRLRADADAKQEELRLMVGERYRDLLQSSTSILALSKSSKNVLAALGEMRDTVNAIGPARAPQLSSTREDKHLQAWQSLAAHVKLLLDAPEYLWRLMEKKAYLNAAWLCLLARVVHRALSQEDDDQSWQAYDIDVMEQLPLVQRQLDTITPFRSQISHRATLSLREASSTPGEVCATLLSLHLLESRPLPETISIYLAQRTKTLSSMLTRNTSTSANGDSKSNGKTPQRARKAVVRETKQKALAALDAMSRTVGTARATFAESASGNPSLMQQALQFFQSPSDKPGSLPAELQLSTQILLEALPSAAQFVSLPQSIRSFEPYIDGSSITTPALLPRLRSELESWFKMAVEDVQSALAEWFAALDRVHEVWDVRSVLLARLKSTAELDSSERSELESMVNEASQKQAAAVWRTALSLLEASFQDAVVSAATSLKDETGQHRHDVYPVEHLYNAPSIPSVTQSGAQNSLAATQFMKYNTSLRDQLAGRTPLLGSALATLERHALEIQKDVVTMFECDEADSHLIAQLATSYHSDAEHTCLNICEMLDKVVLGENSSLNSSVFIGRICQELASSSMLFARLGCEPATADAFRERLSTLRTTSMKKWQEHIVPRIITDNFDGSHVAHRNQSHEDSPTCARPSHLMIQAFTSLSSEVQHLGVCLEEHRRRQQVGSTLQMFIVGLLDRLERGDPPFVDSDLQTLWDLTLLERLVSSWGHDSLNTSARLDASIAHQRDRLANAALPSQEAIASSVQDYITRTQILLAGLLPSQAVAAPTKPEKPVTLLLHGMPAAEQRFESPLELVKTPPRFGLLLVGGATVR